MPQRQTVLKLNGKPFSSARPSPTVAKLKSFLDSSPADEVYTSSEISRRCRVSMSTLTKSSISSRMDGYSILHSCNRYWGNPKAIFELKRQLEAGA